MALGWGGSAADLSPEGEFGEGPAAAGTLRCLPRSIPAPGAPMGSRGFEVVLPWGTPNPSRVSTAPGSAHPLAPPCLLNP